MGSDPSTTGTERSTRVGHVYDDSGETDVYVARGSGKRSMGELPIGKRGWLGNPYTVASYGREGCIEKFREDFEERLQTDEEFRAAIRDLAGQTLACFCQRLEDDEPACHGEVIAEWADRLASEDDGLRADGGADQSFAEWLQRKEEEAQEKYRGTPRSEGSPRVNDVALGRLRAYRNARRVFLEREEHFGDGSDDENCSLSTGSDHS